ncbi:MAG: hypothetical protein MI861_21545, partial [Pirellulales bacterium]|nr:hypothetical protein [Pirellulales bacterium]
MPQPILPLNRRKYLKFTFMLAVVAAAGQTWGQDLVPIPEPIAEASSRYAEAVESHLDYLTEHSLDELGEVATPMWLATIDLRTNGLPAKLLPARPRWRGGATSAGGANLYWDQPSILAAYELSKRTGCACYEDAADAYISSFLEHCVFAPSGLLQWGHQRYYDVTSDQVKQVAGGFHQCRPHVPAWETLWAIDSEVTRKAMVAM